MSGSREIVELGAMTTTTGADDDRPAGPGRQRWGRQPDRAVDWKVWGGENKSEALAVLLGIAGFSTPLVHAWSWWIMRHIVQAPPKERLRIRPGGWDEEVTCLLHILEANMKLKANTSVCCEN